MFGNWSCLVPCRQIVIWEINAKLRVVVYIPHNCCILSIAIINFVNALKVISIVKCSYWFKSIHLILEILDWHCLYAFDGNGKIQTVSGKLPSPGAGKKNLTLTQSNQVANCPSPGGGGVEMTLWWHSHPAIVKFAQLIN